MKEYKLKINGNDYNVTIGEVEGNSANIEVNGVPYAVEFEQAVSKPKPKAIKVVNKPAASAAAPAATVAKVAAPAAAAGETVVESQLPGVVLQVTANVGDDVKKGQQILVLEAMKMENSIEATCDGTLKKILVQKGDSVLEGAQLAIIG